MRSIKFRAWHFNSKKMLEVDELNHISSWSFDGMIGVNGIDRTIGIQGGKHNDCILMQSTGIIDRNGKEIYEGDIILSQGQTRVVRYYNDLAQFVGAKKEKIESVDDWITLEFVSEVIGNIHENPELINT